MRDTPATRVRWTEIARRFTHIDATFVEADCRLGRDTGSSRYVVRFYPFWEHPDYVSAIERGLPWGFDYPEEAKREVTVHPVDLVAFRCSRRFDVTDWGFSDEHPILWEYEERGPLFCNRDFDADAIVARIMATEPPWITPADLHRYLGHGRRTGAPFALPAIPRTPFLLIRRALEDSGVRIYAPREPQPGDALVALVVEGEDYLIARDFELDVPEFVHEPAWFRP